MSEHVLLHFSLKNTFLDVRAVEDLPPVARKKSWSAGDPWPAELTFLQEVGEFPQVENQPKIREQDLQDQDPNQSPNQGLNQGLNQGPNQGPNQGLNQGHEVHEGCGTKMQAKHRAGRCKPCVFFASDHGCPDAACSFCHLAHPLPPKQRPQKLLRDEFRAAVRMVFRQNQDQKDLRLALKHLAVQHPYLFRYIMGQMDTYSQSIALSN